MKRFDKKSSEHTDNTFTWCRCFEWVSLWYYQNCWCTCYDRLYWWRSISSWKESYWGYISPSWGIYISVIGSEERGINYAESSNLSDWYRVKEHKIMCLRNRTCLNWLINPSHGLGMCYCSALLISLLLRLLHTENLNLHLRAVITCNWWSNVRKGQTICLQYGLLWEMDLLHHMTD